MDEGRLLDPWVRKALAPATDRQTNVGRLHVQGGGSIVSARLEGRRGERDAVPPAKGGKRAGG